MALLEVESISKAFAGTPVLREVSFRVEEGQIACLLGPSGCGKTTLLRIVAGLETADAGQVIFSGRPLDDVEVHRRGFGLMFQDFALFPHKDVVANVAFGLRMQALPRQQVEARIAEMLDLVGLAGYERRRVYDLSGGEQQRVALARSLAPGPRLLMLDEPLGSLDRALREGLMNDLRAILKQVGVTSIYVTHDQQEAFAVADRVMIMDRGCIVQQGTPQSVYWQPASPWIARFLGLSNLVPGRVVALDPESGQRASPVVETALGRFAPPQAEGYVAGQPVTLLIRPEAARLADECPDDEALIVEGMVSECSFRGGYSRLVIRHQAGPDLAFRLVSQAPRLLEPGEPVRLALRRDGVSLLVEENDEQAASG
ncbi:MAG: ABC transporter ATP-binding protein [Anaerolineae bacterium]|jgi:ABC-type Fe3+/spermidine/putrescine transport system ATPase subunit